MAVKNYYDMLQLVLAEFLERGKVDEGGFKQASYVAHVAKVMPPAGELSFFTSYCLYSLQQLSRYFKGCGLSSAHLCLEMCPSKDHAQDQLSVSQVGCIKESSNFSCEQGKRDSEILDAYDFIMDFTISLLG